MDRAGLLALLDEAFEKRAWHGPNLRGSLRGVGVEEAGWRPGAGRHNIWELAVHAAYWKYAVRRKLTGEKRGSFALEGSNWFARRAGGPGEGGVGGPVGGGGGPIGGKVDERAWKRDVALLVAEHKALRGAVAGMRSFTEKHLFLVRGAAAHDLYHAGQVTLIKRLWQEKGSR